MKRLTVLFAVIASFVGIVTLPSTLRAQQALNPNLWACNPSDCYAYLLVPPGTIIVNRLRAYGVCYDGVHPSVPGAIQATNCQNWVNLYLDGGASFNEPIADFVWVEGEADAGYMGGVFYQIEMSQDCDGDVQNIIPPPVSC